MNEGTVTEITPRTEAHVVIVGAGPSGVSMLGSLVRCAVEGSVTLVDPIDPGFGEAFGEMCAADPILVCNTSIGAMAVNAADPNDLYDYLVERGWPVCQDDSIPRHIIGEYARARYLEYKAAGGTRLVVRHVRARVTRITPDGDDYSIQTDIGQTLAATHVVNAVGLAVGIVPPEFAEAAANPRIIRGAFPATGLRKVAAGSKVLVVGLRNSGVDAAIILNEAGVNVTLTSPNGRLSAVRNRLRRPADPNFDLEIVRKALDPDDPDFLMKGRGVLSAALSAVSGKQNYAPAAFDGSTIDELRFNLRLAETGEVPWSDLIFDGINSINSITTTWTPDQRKALVSAAFKQLYRYAASLPHLSAVRMLGFVDAGLLDVSPQYLSSVAAHEDSVEITWADGTTETFDHVVLTAGYHAPRLTTTDGESISIDTAGASGGLLELDTDLRARFPGAAQAEKIWAVGSATSQRVLFSGVLWVAARQAEMIANAIEKDAARVKEMVA